MKSWVDLCENSILGLSPGHARDVNVLCLGLVQSLFEGSMYTFVLEWTPALSQATFAPIPHGYIFASFMVATMMGSSIFKLLSKTIRPESFMRYVLLVSAVCLGVPIVMPNSAVSIFLAFLVFEVSLSVTSLIATRESINDN
ncbi:hypothetical protein TELCIR_11383 [Teladorsagia circumcincta]|uniref:Uncharacterized protein n=1 Tax=Teladorsagia circumcincta TaxID=45464 RepID=A0A2G9U9H6_TELCI|nr:hypothetical protein TELCIR_11383 [Teladorsagia circumcincta]